MSQLCGEFWCFLKSGSADSSHLCGEFWCSLKLAMGMAGDGWPHLLKTMSAAAAAAAPAAAIATMRMRGEARCMARMERGLTERRGAKGSTVTPIVVRHPPDHTAMMQVGVVMTHTVAAAASKRYTKEK